MLVHIQADGRNDTASKKKEEVPEGRSSKRFEATDVPEEIFSLVLRESSASTTGAMKFLPNSEAVFTSGVCLSVSNLVSRSLPS
jgi:hypothetical protein